ncbi:hypothetical protein DFP73DRAFT_564997 [Morchella snyderi]|nr:hypothetical protein DFP73DRAFT_564997 [Morchella snyderi]
MPQINSRDDDLSITIVLTPTLVCKLPDTTTITMTPAMYSDFHAVRTVLNMITTDPSEGGLGSMPGALANTLLGHYFPATAGFAISIVGAPSERHIVVSRLSTTTEQQAVNFPFMGYLLVEVAKTGAAAADTAERLAGYAGALPHVDRCFAAAVEGTHIAFWEYFSPARYSRVESDFYAAVVLDVNGKEGGDGSGKGKGSGMVPLMPPQLTQAALHELDPGYQPGGQLQAYTWDLSNSVHARYIHDIFLYMVGQNGGDVKPVNRGVAR